MRYLLRSLKQHLKNGCEIETQLELPLSVLAKKLATTTLRKSKWMLGDSSPLLTESTLKTYWFSDLTENSIF